MKDNKIELDCGHKSNRWVKINGRTVCFTCYKSSKHRRSNLKKHYANNKW